MAESDNILRKLQYLFVYLIQQLNKFPRSHRSGVEAKDSRRSPLPISVHPISGRDKRPRVPDFVPFSHSFPFVHALKMN